MLNLVVQLLAICTSTNVQKLKCQFYRNYWEFWIDFNRAIFVVIVSSAINHLHYRFIKIRFHVCGMRGYCSDSEGSQKITYYEDHSIIKFDGWIFIIRCTINSIWCYWVICIDVQIKKRRKFYLISGKIILIEGEFANYLFLESTFIRYLKLMKIFFTMLNIL